MLGGASRCWVVLNGASWCEVVLSGRSRTEDNNTPCMSSLCPILRCRGKKSHSQCKKIKSSWCHISVVQKFTFTWNTHFAIVLTRRNKCDTGVCFRWPASDHSNSDDNPIRKKCELTCEEDSFIMRVTTNDGVSTCTATTASVKRLQNPHKFSCEAYSSWHGPDDAPFELTIDIDSFQEVNQKTYCRMRDVLCQAHERKITDCQKLKKYDNYFVKAKAIELPASVSDGKREDLIKATTPALMKWTDEGQLKYRAVHFNPSDLKYLIIPRLRWQSGFVRRHDTS